MEKVLVVFFRFFTYLAGAACFWVSMGGWFRALRPAELDRRLLRLFGHVESSFVPIQARVSGMVVTRLQVRDALLKPDVPFNLNSWNALGFCL